jgi:hypothetical protein
MLREIIESSELGDFDIKRKSGIIVRYSDIRYELKIDNITAKNALKDEFFKFLKKNWKSGWNIRKSSVIMWDNIVIDLNKLPEEKVKKLFEMLEMPYDEAYEHIVLKFNSEEDCEKVLEYLGGY